MRTRFNRPSPALVISVIALFVALGGTGYAAATGSIDSREIKNNSISSIDVRNNSLTGTDVKNNSLTGSDITESRLGKVPSAANADTAGRAATAGTAGSANSANTANSANSANTATVGGPAAYAEIESSGAVDTGSPSRGITNANVTHPATGIYCFDLPFKPQTASAQGNPDNVAGADDAILVYGLDPSDFNPCPATAEAEIRYVDASDGVLQSDDFNVQFDQ